jgi:hypothetical protein
MFIRPGFITNSSSSCMIVWKKNPSPDEHPEMTRYGGMYKIECPHCGEFITVGASEDSEQLDEYMDGDARRIVMEKLMKGCTIFYNIDYMCTYPEDEIEHGDDESGWYSFQC